MNRSVLKNILQNQYDRDQWISTLQFLTGKRDLLTVNLSPKIIEIQTQEAEKLVKYFHQIGSVKTSDGVVLPIFEIILEDNIRIEHNRVSVNEFIKKYIIKDAVKGALTTFSYDNDHEKKEWRFSFISKNSANDFFAEAEAEETNPKKFTYIFGTDEEHRTAIERLYNLEESRFRLEDFFEAFNVEPVSKKFFEEYKHLYKEFSDFILENETYKSIFVKSDTNTEKEIRNFVSRLMGRIVFLYFLQKKNWLGASSQDYKDGSTSFLSDLFFDDVQNQEDFYRKYLCPVFFNALNTPDRKKEQLVLENGKTVCIPFLNGGLFEEEQEPEGHRNIQFPAQQFKMLFDFFNGFNFTVYENSPEEHTVAVDPEMLGHIFENLIDYNKDTGTFYTPKEIVQYMTQESLVEYLNTHLEKDRTEIENLIKNQSATAFSDAELSQINTLLDEVKICDPAIGSGAFPMGMLQEIFNLKAIIAYELKKEWKPAEVKQKIIQESIYGVDLDEGAVEIARLRFWLSLVVDEKIPKALPNLDYKIMQGNSLLESFKGIDLSNLGKVEEMNVVEQSSFNFGEEYAKEITVFDAVSFETLQQLVNNYFTYSNTNGKNKSNIKKEINEIIEGKIHTKIFREKKRLQTVIDGFYKKYNITPDNDLVSFNAKSKEIKELFANKEKLNALVSIEQELISFQSKKERPYFLWHLFFADVLDNGGFDIVIGNPPYIKEYANKKAFDGFRESKYYKGKMDLWYGFASLGLDILKDKGTECFIAQSNWITSAGASILRNDILQRTEIKQFVDFGDYKVFQSAGIQTMIYLLKKETEPSENYKIYYAGLSESNITKNQLQNFLNKNITESKIKIFEKYIQDFEPANFKNNFINFSKPSVKNILNIIKNRGNFYLENNEATNGIHSHHDFVSNAMLKILGNNYKVNDGIFTLKTQDVENLKLNDVEKKLLKPYYSGTQKVNKYLTEKTDESVIYTDSTFRDSSKMEKYPILKSHLDNFSKVITSDNKPYGLHRSRNDYFFKDEKIVSIRKCSEPTFSYANEPGYFSATFYIIKSERINLKYLTTFLNSKIVYYWLKNEGKMQGDNFQIDKEPLLKIPIYKPDNYEPFISLFEIISFTLKQKENIIDNIENKHIAQFFQEIVDAYFFEIYFEKEMREKNILVIEGINKHIKSIGDFISLKAEKKLETVQTLYSIFSNPDNEVRNRIKSFSLLSPDVLGVILNS